MEIRCLGPLEVWFDGSQVPIGGRVPRTVLAALVLGTDESVSMSRLVGAVWDEPPATARRQIQNTVAGLRRRLGVDLAEPIGDGYRVRLDGVRVDALDFAAAVERATRSRRQPRAALESLRHGLALWRGRPLANLTGRWVASTATRWREAWLAAMEDRAELELRLGEPDRVAGDLRRLLADHPLRQRSVALLMLALYRNGRVDEAVAVYEDLRATLLDELGLDPNPELDERYRAVLRRDPELLELDGRRAPGGAAPVPAQLPSDLSIFVGRAEILTGLSEIETTSGGSRPVVITGPAGTGKTAVAVHWAHRQRGRFTDGQLYVNLRGFDHVEPLTPVEALGRFIRSLRRSPHPAPADLEEARTLYRSLIDGKRLLVVLDNARSAEQVRPLLPAASGSLAIVTSRERLTGLTALNDAVVVELAPMEQDDAMDLLSGVVGTDRIGGDATAVHRLAKHCGGLPLALRIAAAQLVANPRLTIADLVRELDSADRLSVLRIDGDSEAAVSVALDRSDRTLDADTRELLYLLSMLPGDDIPVSLAVTVAGGDTGPVLDRLRRLESAHLVEQRQPRRYRFHDLTGEYARRQAETTFAEPVRQRFQDRVIDWYHDNRYALTVEDVDNLRTVCRSWAWHPRFWRLPHALVHSPAAGGLSPANTALVDEGIRSAAADGSALARQVRYHCLAIRHGYDGDLPTGIHYGERALAVAPDADGSLHFHQGIRLRCVGDLKGAEEKLTTAYRIAVDREDPVVTFGCERALGNLFRLVGRYSDAEEMLSRVSKRAEALDTGILSAEALMFMIRLRLSDLYIDLSDPVAADEALAPVARNLDALPGHQQIRVLLCRGRIHRLRLEYGNAIRDYRRALALTHELNHYVDRMIECQSELAEVYCDLGDHRNATVALAAVPRQAGNRLVAAAVLVATARTRLLTGELDAAETAATTACRRYEGFGVPLWHARCLTVLAEVHHARDDPRRADGYRRRARDILVGLGVPRPGPMPSGASADECRPR